MRKHRHIVRDRIRAAQDTAEWQALRREQLRQRVVLNAARVDAQQCEAALKASLQSFVNAEALEVRCNRIASKIRDRVMQEDRDKINCHPGLEPGPRDMAGGVRE